jgi:hypothetical protein
MLNKFSFLDLQFALLLGADAPFTATPAPLAEKMTNYTAASTAELPVHNLRAAGQETDVALLHHRSSSEPLEVAAAGGEPPAAAASTRTSLTAMMSSQSSLLVEATTPLHLEILDNEIKNLQETSSKRFKNSKSNSKIVLP